MVSSDKELDREELEKALVAARRAVAQAKYEQIARFAPWKKQREFATCPRHRVMFSGPNQVGKSTILAYVAAMHLTGLYPKGWDGPRYTAPGKFALGGVTAQAVRDLLVEKLLGPVRDRGTGMVPAHAFDEKKDLIYVSSGVRHSLDYFMVNWHHPTEKDARGRPKVVGKSQCYVFSYSSNWERIQGYRLDGVFLDEEPPIPVFDEIRARTFASEGRIWIAETPLQGEYLYDQFDQDESGQYKLVTCTIYECEHMSKEKIDRIVADAKNSPMAEARLFGRPVRGSGVVFPTPDAQVFEEPFPIPSHWPQIIGLDFAHGFGIAAAVKLAYDPDSDIIHITAEFKAAEGMPMATFAERVGGMGGRKYPVSYPHDGNVRDRGGESIADAFRSMGLTLLSEPAHYLDSQGRKMRAIIPVIEDEINRMEDGRFRVFSTCTGWMEEKRKYRQEKGVVKSGQNDHLLDATHKAMMDRRFASSGVSPVDSWQPVSQYDFFS